MNALTGRQTMSPVNPRGKQLGRSGGSVNGGIPGAGGRDRGQNINHVSCQVICHGPDRPYDSLHALYRLLSAPLLHATASS